MIMRKLILLLISVGLLYSCSTSSSKKETEILIDGVLIETINVRTVPNANRESTVIYTAEPGDIVQIVSFDIADKDGYSWCEVKLNRSQSYRGEEIHTGWMVYKQKSLPWIVSMESYNNIERMYEMEYEKKPNEILTEKAWLTQAIYDYTYNDYLKDIEQYYNDLDDKEIIKQTPSKSVDYDEEQCCRVRLSTASKERKEDALYAVVFNQTPRTIHFFRQDPRTYRGSFVKYEEMYFLNSSIKTLQRKKRKSSVYYSDHYGYKEKLALEYDAIRIRPRQGKERYIVYNGGGYTSPNLENLYLSKVTEY